MSHFRLICSGIDVAPLLAEIDAHPELWDQQPERRAGNSPHREVSDIWVRYASREAMRESGFAQEPHRSFWWPACHWLPSVQFMASSLGTVLCERPVHRNFPRLLLGGVLITRIPPGKQVYEHDDRGTWHAHYYDLKVWTVLRGNDRCVNTVEDEVVVWKPGEAWSHDNLLRHSVVNGGDTERLCLICCFRRAF